MTLYDLEGRIVVGNLAAIKLLGHPAGALVGSHFSAHLAPGSVAPAEDLRKVVIAGEACEFEAVFMHADGHPVNVSTTVVPARLDDQIAGVYGIVREVHIEREVAAAVEQAHRLRSLYLIAASSAKTPGQQIEEALELGIELLNVESAVVMCLANEEVRPSHSAGAIPLGELGTLSLDASLCREMFGTFDSVGVDDTGRAPWDSEPTRRRLPWRSYIATTFEIGSSFAGVILFGSRHQRGDLFSSTDREFVGLLSAVIGSTLDRQSQQQRLDALAFSDPLTGLPNRTLLQDRLQQLIAESHRNDESFAVHFLDLDGFKHVNDTAGHAIGDKVLRETGQRLKEALRESDSVARLGGDEFIILQTRVRHASETIALAHTLLASMRLPFVFDAGAFVLSASIGISLFPSDGDSVNTLLRHADIALYRAKSSGRNGLAFYNARRDLLAPRASLRDPAAE